MKRLTYILLSLCCLTLYSCGMTEPWKDWENEGKMNEDRLRPSEVKSLLCEAEGWRMTYKGVDFYFEFSKDDKVVSNTDETILENEVESTYRLDYEGEKVVTVKLDNNGAFKYLQDGGINTLYITSYSANQMKGNDGTDTEFTLQLISAEDLANNLVAKHAAIVARNKAQFMERLKTELNYGILKGADNKFVAHYRFLQEGSLNQIRISVLSNRVLTHSTYSVTIDMDDEKATVNLGFSSLKGYSVSKLYYKFVNGAFTTDTDVKIIARDMTSINYYKNDLKTLQINAWTGSDIHGDAKQELWQELNAYAARGVEVNDRSQRPLIFCGSNYTSYDANYTLQDDVITFHNTTPPYSVVGWESKHEEVQRTVPKFLNAYYHADGFYLVYEVTDKTRLYFLSPTTDNWFMADK